MVFRTAVWWWVFRTDSFRTIYPNSPSHIIVTISDASSPVLWSQENILLCHIIVGFWGYIRAWVCVCVCVCVCKPWMGPTSRLTYLPYGQELESTNITQNDTRSNNITRRGSKRTGFICLYFPVTWLSKKGPFYWFIQVVVSLIQSRCWRASPQQCTHDHCLVNVTQGLIAVKWFIWLILSFILSC